MDEQRHKPTLEDVWTFMCEGCNTHEIATWYGMDEEVVRAWMQRARRAFLVGQVAA